MLTCPRNYKRKDWMAAYRAARLTKQGKPHDGVKFMLKCAAMTLLKNEPLNGF